MDSSIKEDWFSISTESSLKIRLDHIETILDTLVIEMKKQNESMKSIIEHIKHNTEDIKLLQDDIILRTDDIVTTVKKITDVTSDEFYMIKQRQLNMMIREKIPTPFIPTITSPLFKIKYTL